MAKQPIKRKETQTFAGNKLDFIKKYNEDNKLDQTKQKEQKWIVLTGDAQKAVEDSIGVPGLPLGDITTILGHSNTGKTTFVIETIKACQYQEIVPVYFDLETALKWDHAKAVGVQGVTETVDEETGEIIYGPPENMIFYNPVTLFNQYGCYNHEDGKYDKTPKRDNYCIADVALCIRDILKKQKDENWPVSLYFIVDSVGTGESYRSAVARKTNNMWYAGEFTTSFDIIGNVLIPASKYVDNPWDNGMLLINKVSVSQTFTGIKVATAKGSSYSGDYMRRFCIFLGNQASHGTKADGVTYLNEFYECARIVNISIIKNHITKITREGKIVTTPDGLISLNDLKDYKEQYKKWLLEELKNKTKKEINVSDLKDEERDVQD